MSGRASAKIKRKLDPRERLTRKIMSDLLDVVQASAKIPAFQKLPSNDQINIMLGAIAGDLGIIIKHWSEQGANPLVMIEAAMQYMSKAINAEQDIARPLGRMQ